MWLKLQGGGGLQRGLDLPGQCWGGGEGGAQWGGHELLAPQAMVLRTMTSAFPSGPWGFTRWKGGETDWGYSRAGFYRSFPTLWCCLGD